MPPRKRDGSESNTARDEASTPSSGKRQRVSLACDACRIARERCDGVHPNCGTCVSQSRTCSYTPASKKRGVQTGYLRTIELSLAWLFDQVPESEEALHRLLTKDGGIDGVRVLQKKDKAGNRLHKRWTKGRVNKEISRMLSNGTPQKADTSAEESDTDGGGAQAASLSEDATYTDGISTIGSAESPIVQRPGMPSRHPPAHPSLKLPANWQRLVDIYISYTHCWFPILDKDSLMQNAMSYPPEGIAAQRNNSDLPPNYAELWAVLALAAFQDSMSGNPRPSEPTLSPKRIYSIARDMIPSEEQRFELPHLRALLIHSLVLVGQGADLAAWMLVGTATRLALHMRETGDLHVGDGTHTDSIWPSGARAFAACFVLDTLTSTCLGQATFLKADAPELQATFHTLPGEEIWRPVPGFRPECHDVAGAPHVRMNPLKNFQQLLKFLRTLNTSIDLSIQHRTAPPRASAEDLVRCLDPEFAFCNNVVFGSTPPVPSAYLLQAIFLASTIHIARGYRSSLLSSFLESVESYISEFGECASSPFLVCLIGLVERCGHVDRLHESDRTKWQSSLESLRLVWTQQGTVQGRDHARAEHTATTSQAVNVPRPPAAPYATYNEAQRAAPEQGAQETNLLRSDDTSGHQESVSYAAHGFPIYPHARNSASQRSMLSSGTSLPIQQSKGPTASDAYPGEAGPSTSQPIDYDAMLEELGSIDCTDGLDMDPQFMTNLGFAPGCDLGEMFQGDFGL